MLLRLLSTALLATCAVLLATFEPVRLELAASTSSCDGGAIRAPARTSDIEAVAVVDVAAGLEARELARLIHLRPGEHVAAVNDRTVESDLEVGAVISSLRPGPGEFLDVTVAGATARRVLVMVH